MQKIKKVTAITKKEAKNGQFRWTLKFGKTSHAVAVSDTDVCPAKIGDRVVIIERDINVGRIVDADGKVTNEGTPAKAWYFDQLYYDGFISDLANEDVDYLLEQFKAAQRNTIAKSVTAESLLKGAI